MRQLIPLFVVLLFLSCNGKGTKNNSGKSSDSKAPIVIDLTKDYPKMHKSWQEIADVRYVALQTTKDALVNTSNDIFFTDSTIIVCNHGKSGDIMIFDYQGNIKTHFNRKGRSGTEYNNITRTAYDELRHEIYVYDNDIQTIFTYSENGQFLHKIKTPESMNMDFLYSFDENAFLTSLHKRGGPEADKHQFVFLSKENGEVDNIRVTSPDVIPFHYLNGAVSLALARDIVRSGDDFWISNVSNDTVFQLQKDRQLRPVFVRTPSVFETKIPLIWVTYAKTESCYFGARLEYDYRSLQSYTFETLRELVDKLSNLKMDRLYIDLSNDSIYTDDFYNADYPDAPGMRNFSWNDIRNNTCVAAIEAGELTKAKEEGKLSGPLKEIAEGLSDDDNPVLEFVTFK